jgi:hypothetical protein
LLGADPSARYVPNDLPGGQFVNPRVGADLLDVNCLVCLRERAASQGSFVRVSVYEVAALYGNELAGMGFEKLRQESFERLTLLFQPIHGYLLPRQAFSPLAKGLELVGGDDHRDPSPLTLQEHRTIRQGGLIEGDRVGCLCLADLNRGARCQCSWPPDRV